MNWFGTSRLRAGVVVDNMLLYVTGGLAYAGIKQNATINDPAIPATERFNTSSARWGAALGLGAGIAMSSNWTLKGEALYLKFEQERLSEFSTNGNQLVHFDHQDSMWVGRIGLNYRLGN